MTRKRRPYLAPCLILAGLVTLGLARPTAAGTIVSVTNTSNGPDSLADLIAYQTVEGRVVNRREIVNTLNPAQTIRFAAREVKLFDAGFELNQLELSTLNELRQQRNAVLFNWSQVQLQQNPKKMSMIGDPTGMTPVFLAIDFQRYTFEPPSDGTIVPFSGGLNPSLPGWFVGTAIDLGTGVVSNPFTGSVEVIRSNFEVFTTVPEPGTLTLVSIGVIGLIIYMTHRVAFRY